MGYGKCKGLSYHSLDENRETMTWNQKERERVRLLSNEDLFEAIKLHYSDDYYDLVTAEMALEELEVRLRLSGFLKPIL